MNMSDHSQNSVYTQEIIEFAAAGVEFANKLEHASELELSEFTEKMLKILPTLYLKTLALPPYLYNPEEDRVDEYINEVAYEKIKNDVSVLLEEHDSYLTTHHEDMQYSDTPIAVSVSEFLADVYQQVGNLLGILKEENEYALPTAIGKCLFYFGEYWGRNLLSALTTLHEIKYQILVGDTDNTELNEDY